MLLPLWGLNSQGDSPYLNLQCEVIVRTRTVYIAWIRVFYTKVYEFAVNVAARSAVFVRCSPRSSSFCWSTSPPLGRLDGPLLLSDKRRIAYMVQYITCTLNAKPWRHRSSVNSKTSAVNYRCVIFVTVVCQCCANWATAADQYLPRPDRSTRSSQRLCWERTPLAGPPGWRMI